LKRVGQWEGSKGISSLLHNKKDYKSGGKDDKEKNHRGASFGKKGIAERKRGKKHSNMGRKIIGLNGRVMSPDVEAVPESSHPISQRRGGEDDHMERGGEHDKGQV